MPGRLSTVTRGRFIDGIDAILRVPKVELLERHEKTSPSDITALGTQIKVAPDAGYDHSEQEFFGDAPPKAYFPPGGAIPDAEGKKAILISGSIQAQRVALYENPDAAPAERKKRAKPLPVVSYWISGVSEFEVYVALSSTLAEVHMLIMTPMPEGENAVPAKGRIENIWAIATDERIKVLHDAMPLSFGAAAPFDVRGARCQKLVGY